MPDPKVSRRRTSVADDGRRAVRQRPGRRLRHRARRRRHRAAARQARRGSRPGAALLDPAQNNTFRAINRAWNERRDRAVRRRPLHRHAACQSAQQNELVKSLALAAERRRPRTRAPPIERKPRIGLFQPWTGSMDEGWTRWVLEQYGFESIDAPSRGLQVAARPAKSTS